MAADEASSSSFSSGRRWSYDVFLSFRGEDTRKNFTDHLYFGLKDAGVNVFRDDNELRRGEDITTELIKAIEESRISLIVFSRNYANSRWCLDELVKIMECRRTLSVQQVVLPIFYDVDPSHVRKQEGCFAEAFIKHEHRFAAERDKVSRWRAALTEAANLSGWDLTTANNGYEAKVIKKIVAEILIHLNNTHLDVAIYPVGIESRVQDINHLLQLNPNNVRIIGICAMGGMGKTTIAKAVYNQFFHSFESKSFLEGVREISKQPDGQVRLQQQLLYDILKTKKIKVDSVARGINVIKERLHGKKVLLVLDDVSQPEQLNTIARHHSWFGLGSRIIITTRDEHLLRKVVVDEIYSVKELSNDESLELFSWHAFGRSHPEENYAELSKDVIGYCNGLPLALEIVGSFLLDRSVLEWKSALNKMKRIPHDPIQKTLKISFDALDDTEKDIFLDIACFFIRMDKDYVTNILDGCGFFPEIGISVLVRKCLLKINESNKLMMHDLLRDMGREIVRQESPKEPGARSRLWFYDDALNVLKKCTGTRAVEGLILNLPTSNEVHLKTEAFSKMQKLRLLQLNYVNLSGDYGNLSMEELRWLSWRGFPLHFVPNNFHGEDLVAIDMQYSSLRQVWKEMKLLGKLKVVNLSHSHHLAKTPNFLQLPNLEKFIIKDCISLVEVHPSIGSLDKLVILDMRDCKCLRNLPGSICMLKSLEILNLSGCSKFENLPEDIGEMEALKELLADRTAIRQVPSSIVCLKNLKGLSLRGCNVMSLPSISISLASVFWSLVSPTKNSSSISPSLLPSSLLGLSSLVNLSLRDCNLSDESFPKDLGSLSSLDDFDLRSNNFHTLPSSISNLPKLKWLRLDHCTRLGSLPELPTSLEYLTAEECTSLERLSNMSKFEVIPNLILTNCHKLVEILGLDKFSYFRRVDMEGCSNLANTSKQTLLQMQPTHVTAGDGSIYVPGNEIPSWFDHQSMGDSLTLQVPPIFGGRKVKGFAVCVVYECYYDGIKKGSSQDHMWLEHFQNFSLNGGDHLEVEVEPHYRFPDHRVNVKKLGIKLSYYDAAEISSQSDGAESILYNSTLNDNSIASAAGQGPGPSHSSRVDDHHSGVDDTDFVWWGPHLKITIREIKRGQLKLGCI